MIKTRGFASVFNLGLLLLLAATVIIGVYLVGQKVGFKPRASEITSQGEQEAASLKRVKLGLFVSPSFSQSGKIDLNLRWNPVNNNKFSYFTVAVYKADDYTIVPGGEEINVQKNTQITLVDLPAKKGRYYVHLKAVYNSGAPGLDRSSYQYFYDNLTKINPDSLEDVWGAGKTKKGKLISTAKGLGLKISNATDKPEYAFIYSFLTDTDGHPKIEEQITDDFNVKPHPYAIRVSLKDFKATISDKSQAYLAILSPGNKNWFQVGQLSRATLLPGQTENITGFAQLIKNPNSSSPESTFYNFTSVSLPAVLEIVSATGSAVMAKYNSNPLTTDPVNFSRPYAVEVVLQSFRPGLPDISSIFSDFGMVWSDSVSNKSSNEPASDLGSATDVEKLLLLEN